PSRRCEDVTATEATKADGGTLGMRLVELPPDSLKPARSARTLRQIASGRSRTRSVAQAYEKLCARKSNSVDVAQNDQDLHHDSFIGNHLSNGGEARVGDRQGRDEVELEAGVGNLAGFELAWPSKVIPRLGLKSEDGVEGFLRSARQFGWER